jgi:MoaA/NifB/PqqE/SkfB family radical SAM enzyme
MYNYTDIRDIHLEVTSKCQARCPMCPRRINGGMLNPLISLNEITLAQFKEWFTIDFIKQLDNLFMCGNLGDPIIAQDCLEIFQYLKDVNPSIKLSMHTNGSARTIEWWQQLAKVNVRVTFGIDGLEDTHSLYRINTDWQRIINNAEAFIKAGGDAEWHMLVFEHNEHQTGTCQHMADQLGFKKFITKHTSRFTEDKWHVIDDDGKTTHILRPTEISKGMIGKSIDAMISPSEIQCKAVKYKQLYIAADGTISPCCWLDFSWILPKQDSRIDYMDAIGYFPNLNKNTLKEIFDQGYFKQIEDTWAVKPLMECSRQCGKFDKLGAQFVN